MGVDDLRISLCSYGVIALTSFSEIMAVCMKMLGFSPFASFWFCGFVLLIPGIF